MTYKDLLEILQNLSEEELNNTATVFCPDMDEYYPVECAYKVDSTQDQLDMGHLVICTKSYTNS